MSERLSAEQLEYYHRLVDEGKNFGPVQAAHLLAELDAVTRQRDAFENRIDELNRRIALLTANLVLND